MKEIQKVYISKKLNKIGCCCGCQGNYWYASTATGIPPIFKTKVNDAKVASVVDTLAKHTETKTSEKMDQLELTYPTGKKQFFVVFYNEEN